MAVEDEHMTNQEPTPEPEARVGALEIISMPQAHDKGEHVEDAGITEDSLSTVGSPEPPSESDARLAQSMSTTAISPASEPLYLTFPRDKQRVC